MPPPLNMEKDFRNVVSNERMALSEEESRVGKKLDPSSAELVLENVESTDVDIEDVNIIGNFFIVQ